MRALSRRPGTRPTTDLVERIRAVDEAVGLCRGRVEDAVVDRAEHVVRRADRRLAVSGDATVVALAGATGSGKSSLFNAIVGAPVATVGVRRPTTSSALAAAWTASDATELLDWLGVGSRHVLGGGDDSAAGDRSGLVLLDLPDHDSVETANRQEAERLVELVDLLVWVVDPQKYADAALHRRYLVPLARHADSMLVVLNQADRLGAHQKEECLADLRRLLASEGLGKVQVAAVSATTGEGVAGLLRHLDQRVAGKRSAAARLAADLDDVAAALVAACGDARKAAVSVRAVATMNRSFSDAAGVPQVTDAVARAWRRRGAMATGWPVVSWLGRFRPDPLRRLHLDRWKLRRGAARTAVTTGPAGEGSAGLSTTARTSLPAATGIAAARVESAVRELADGAGEGLPRGWTTAVRTAARTNAARLPDALDQAISRADLELHRHRSWWQAVRVLQWLLVLVVVAGLGWLAWGALLAYFQLPPPPRVRWFGLPAPTLLVLGGVLAGFVTAGLSRVGVEVGARRRARHAAKALEAGIAAVTADLVLTPLNTELDRYASTLAALSRAHH